jgi:hypothetical protein
VVVSGWDGFVSLRARGLGDRPANDSGTLTAPGYLVLDLVASRKFGPWQLGVTILNLTDTRWREAQFAATSRLPGEPAPVEDVHFTPGAPLTALFTIGYTAI